ncbi:MAG: diguanylate cyclase [Thermoleophilaceae bacterium]
MPRRWRCGRFSPTRAPTGDFHAALDRELERARRHGGSLSVVLVDVEGLAQINRARGHVEGGHVLREVGRAVAGVCRACDLAARVGGDKLALVLRSR